jgi:hypothetical protein
MSRSHKKHLVQKDNGKSKRYNKKQANKAARHADLASGCAYKRVYNQYDICDYRCAEWNRGKFVWWDSEEAYQKYLRRLRAK